MNFSDASLYIVKSSLKYSDVVTEEELETHVERIRRQGRDDALVEAKAAEKGLPKSMRVRVVSLHPGRIDTDMQVEMQAQAGRPYRPEEHMRPEDVARTVRLALDLPSSMNIDEIHLRTTEKK